MIVIVTAVYTVEVVHGTGYTVVVEITSVVVMPIGQR